MEQANRDAAAAAAERPRRPYRLTPDGRARLRAAALRTRPWESSTGPKTANGKARSRLNGWKHGLRSAAAREAESEIAECLRAAPVAELHATPADLPRWIRRVVAEVVSTSADVTLPFLPRPDSAHREVLLPGVEDSDVLERLAEPERILER